MTKTTKQTLADAKKSFNAIMNGIKAAKINANSVEPMSRQDIMAEIQEILDGYSSLKKAGVLAESVMNTVNLSPVNSNSGYWALMRSYSNDALPDANYVYYQLQEFIPQLARSTSHAKQVADRLAKEIASEEAPNTAE